MLLSTMRGSVVRRGFVASAAIAAALSLPYSATSVSAETLKQALSATYRYSPQLDAERARLRATDEEVARANAGYRPNITGQADVTYQDSRSRPAGGANSGGNTAKGYSINLVQPLFRGFQVTNAVNEAEAAVRAGRETLRDVERQVLLAAVTSYMDVVRDQAVVRLQENNVSVLSRELKATQDRFSVGEVTKTDVSQAIARRAGSVSQLDLARANLKTSRASYEQVVGHPPTNVNDPAVPERTLPKSLEEAIAIGQRENPLLIAALYREQGSRYTVDRIRGELLPSVQVEASYGERWSPSRLVDESESGTVATRMTVPIYEGGEVYARVRQAKHTHVSRLQEIEQVRTQVRQSVVATWSQLQAARAQLQSDRTQVEANQTALSGVREEEKVGQRTLLDVLNAEQEMLNSQVTLETTRRNLIVASYSVLAAIGRLDSLTLGTASEIYDPEENYSEVRRKWWGLSITHENGRNERVDLWETHGRHQPVK